MKYCQDLTTWWLHHISKVHIKILFAFHFKILLLMLNDLVQGILNDKVSLYRWPPVWLVWNQLYDDWNFLFLFTKLTNSNQSNRRSTLKRYFSFVWCMQPFGSACLLFLCVWYNLFVSVVNAIKNLFISVSDAMMFKLVPFNFFWCLIFERMWRKWRCNTL